MLYVLTLPYAHRISNQGGIFYQERNDQKTKIDHFDNAEG